MLARFLILLLVALPMVVYAHPGRTDANGCHLEKKTGIRHCHTAPPAKAKVSARSAARATAPMDDKNCSDFSSQKAAQDFFIANGGPKKDPHRLDGDKDGKACEELE